MDKAREKTEQSVERHDQKKSATLICLLDKQYPPDHSFVTGMLADVLPRKGRMHVKLLVGVGAAEGKQTRKYGGAVCIPSLPALPTRRWRRILALGKAFCWTRMLIKQAHQKGHGAILLVRNDPLMLLVAGLLRHSAERLVFQSSFPLEETHNSAVKKWLHRTLYKFGGRCVDAVLAVSPLGLERTRKLMPWVKEGMYIPLLSDLHCPAPSRDKIQENDRRPARFVYAGTHRARRQLDVVVKAAVAALDHGANAEFTFIGGKSREIEGLRRVEGVTPYEEKGIIKFIGMMPRPELAEWLVYFDVGLSLIPDLSYYKEASPTKPAEYMGAGLAVLASGNVELQATFIERSGAGEIVSFDTDNIKDGILSIAGSRKQLERKKDRARLFAATHLQYDQYLSGLLRLLSDK